MPGGATWGYAVCDCAGAPWRFGLLRSRRSFLCGRGSGSGACLAGGARESSDKPVWLCCGVAAVSSAHHAGAGERPGARQVIAGFGGGNPTKASFLSLCGEGVSALREPSFGGRSEIRGAGEFPVGCWWLEQFRNTRRLFERVKGGFFLIKKPLKCVVSVYTNSETAVSTWIRDERVGAARGFPVY